MPQTTLYKNTAGNGHRNRYMQTEEVFMNGMKYTDAPHAPGYAKTIVNFNIKNDGEVFVPRGGLRVVRSEVARQSLIKPGTVDELFSDYCVHHTHTMYIEKPDGDAVLCNYVLASTMDDDQRFVLSDARLIIEYENDYIEAVYDDEGEHAAITGALLMKPACTSVHEMNVENPRKRSGIFTSLEGNTHVLVNEDGINHLGKIVARFKDDERVYWFIEKITPTEVQPTQAINYGYNMLKENPYMFSNMPTATGDIVLTGVVPYDEQGKLLLTSRPGVAIDFKLFYKYPQSDVDNGDKYLFQWEVQDLQSNSEAVIAQRVRKSAEYTPGDEVVFKYTPAYNVFSIIVKVYRKSTITELDSKWEEDTDLQTLVTKDDNLVPDQVITLSSYHLTANSGSSMLNTEAASFDVCTATGMCTWQQRVVFWGVTGAKSTLFVSEINDPGYVPYPNNSEVFADNIVCAVPYMANLLVFTKTALYKLTLNADGLSYSTTCVQERLSMTLEDANSVTTVQNMVYFKSNNYYYMIVPNNKSLQTDLQMAPVSRPIEYLLDDFKAGVRAMINEVYNITYDVADTKFDISLLDYHVYVADTQVRNVYKIELNESLGYGEPKTYCLDVVLNYDTVLRAWTCYMYEATQYRMEVYKPTVTGQTQFAYIRELEFSCRVGIAQFDNEEPHDNLPLNEDKERMFGNYQFIDTGYRAFNTEHKKRFREVQFHINSRTADTLSFYTSFTVDDVERQGMYKNSVQQVTDPSDPNYGVIFVEREFIDVKQTPSLTKLDEWKLDTSRFPDLTVYKIRFRVSGKGYGGAVKLLSVNEAKYELLNMSWIYRLMFAR